MEPFQFDYVGYLRNMVFLIILLGAMSYILIKLKTRDASATGLPKLSFLNLPASRQDDAVIEIVERKVLEPRKTIYLLRIFDDQYWLVGSTETEIKAIGQVQAPRFSNPKESEKSFSEHLSNQEQNHEIQKLD